MGRDLHFVEGKMWPTVGWDLPRVSGRHKSWACLASLVEMGAMLGAYLIHIGLGGTVILRTPQKPGPTPDGMNRMLWELGRVSRADIAGSSAGRLVGSL